MTGFEPRACRWGATALPTKPQPLEHLTFQCNIGTNIFHEKLMQWTGLKLWTFAGASN